MLSLILPLLRYFFYRACSATNPIYLLIHPFTLVFYFLLQSKHKGDVSATRPILLDEPEFGVCLPPFLLLLLLLLFLLFLSFYLFIYLFFASSTIMHSSLFSLFSSLCSLGRD